MFRHLLRGGIAAFTLAIMSCDGFAQTGEAAVEPPPQDVSLTPPVPFAPPTTMAEADALASTVYSDDDGTKEEAPASSEGEPRRPWKLTLHGVVSGTYDNNIFISRRNRQEDFILTASPGLQFVWGDWLDQKGNFFLFDYTLSGLIFADHPSQDTIEEESLLAAQWALSRLTFAFHFRFQDLSSPDVDVGNRTRRQLYGTALLTKYELHDQTSLEANLYNNTANYETRLSSDEWVSRFWFNVGASPKLIFGPGFSVGHLEVENSPSQTYEQALGRLTYAATAKLSFEADGGVEIRQAEATNRVTPVLNLAGTYEPFAETQIKITAYRKVANSASLAGENYTVTGTSVEVTRSVRAGWDLILEGSYNHSAYNATSQNAAPGRTDSYFFVKPSIRFSVGTHVRVDFFYLHQENDSTRGPSSFRDRQAGARVRFDY